MKSLYFTKAGEPRAAFWRCGVCGEDRPHMTPATHVQVGQQLLAVVCMGACANRAMQGISESMPGSFPDVDANGVLL
jgi:hypothetical protein